jgi:hypothetical protein
MIELLEPFSRQVLTELLTVFPTWRAYCSTFSENQRSYLKVEVPPPEGASAGPIEIFTSDDEDLRVHFGSSHWHFSSILDGDSKATGAVGRLREILDEEYVLVTYILPAGETLKDGFSASTFVRADWIPRANYEYFYTTLMRVRSWKGTYDADFPAPYVKDKPPINNRC